VVGHYVLACRGGRLTLRRDARTIRRLASHADCGTQSIGSGLITWSRAGIGYSAAVRGTSIARVRGPSLYTLGHTNTRVIFSSTDTGAPPGPFHIYAAKRP
jgi:hypothetical protein